jgi:hypothetical protein
LPFNSCTLAMTTKAPARTTRNPRINFALFTT